MAKLDERSHSDEDEIEESVAMISRDMVGGFYAVKPLGKVVEFLDSRRKPVKESERSLGAYPYYGANGQQGTINNYIFDEPLVLLAEDGGFFDQPDRGVAYRISGKTWVNNHAHVLRPKQGLDINYLCRVLENYDLTPYVTGTTRGKLTKSGASEILIPLPPIAQQKRIAAILDKAEELRGLRRKALGELDAIVQSIFLEMFGDPVTNPKNNKVVLLSDVTTRITDGVHQKPTYTESGIPFISVKDITTGTLKFDDCKFISQEEHKKFTRRCRPELHDILYTKVGATYGRPALIDIDREFSIYVSVCLIKPRLDMINPLFLCTALGTSAVKNQADRRIKGIGVPDLHLDQIQKFLIPLPSMSKQQEFVLRVKVIKHLKTAHRKSLTQLDALFASLQHRAFRGEL